MKQLYDILFTYCLKPFMVMMVCIVVCAGCAIPREKLAQQTFDEAVDAYMQKRYNKAKILLDSVLFTYPDLKSVVKESKDMLEIIYKTEQERNLLFLDSLLEIREQEIKPLMAQFEAEDKQAEEPVLIHKKQVAARAWDRSYIRAHVDKNGTFYISSHYTGSSHLNHYAIKATVDENYQETDSIGDDAYVHRFDNDGTTWEVVKYKNGSDNGVGSFIATNFDKPIDILFIGDFKYKIRLTDTDKQAFRETYQLALMLRETVQIKSQIRNVKMAMKKKHPEQRKDE